MGYSTATIRSKRTKRRKDDRLRGRHILLVLIMLIIMTWGGILGFEKLKLHVINSSYLKIRGISVDGNKIIETDEILKAANLSKGSSICSINTYYVENLIKHQLRYVDEVEVRRRLIADNGIYGWVDIFVKERKPTALVVNPEMLDQQSEPIYSLIDNNGFVLEEKIYCSQLEYPVIVGDIKSLLSNSNFDIDKAPAFDAALELISYVRSTVPELLNGIFLVDARNPEDIILKVQNNDNIVLDNGINTVISSVYSLNENLTIRIARYRIKEALKSVSTVLLERMRDNKAVKYIDARFPGALYCGRDMEK
ncbi:FtsQ-type POTRA domain-containing protein [Candidatus Poribacteria bacterium]|nr:FtsQ-type POTRA domain-containing protein [Candidatus Poribacteria bacterium]